MEMDTTRSLSKVLQEVRSEAELERFVDCHGCEETLHWYLNQLMGEKDLTTSELIRRSGINKNYIYNILNGERTRPGRDKILALCIGMGASFRETNHALELGKVSALYPKDERDIRIAVAINQGVLDVTKVNLILEESGLDPLLV